MLDRIRYVNNNNEEIIFGSGHLHWGETDLHDYDWSYTTVADRIDTLKRGVRTFELLVGLRDGSLEERNEITDILDYDVREETPGTLHIGDYHIDCYCIGSEKDRWWFDDGRMEATLKFVTDQRYWKKTRKAEFFPIEIEASETGKAYPYGYAYDYAASLRVASEIEVPGRHSANWKLVIHGPAASPAITVGGHVYSIDATVESGGYIIIDSERKTALLIGRRGSITNVFSKQDKESYLFEKLQPGFSEVVWDNSFGFTFLVDEERSEPEWV